MRIVKILLVALMVVALAPYVIAPFYRTGHPVSTLMAWRSLRGAPMHREWIDLAAMSPSLLRSVVAAEDASSAGITASIGARCARRSTMRRRTGRPGAPPPSPSRWQKICSSGRGGDFVRKALEFPLALWIDFVLPKARILEIYLNIAELGPQGQFGVEAASAYAFGKSAANLSPPGGGTSGLDPAQSGQTERPDPGPGVRRLAGTYVARAQANSILTCWRENR